MHGPGQKGTPPGNPATDTLGLLSNPGGLDGEDDELSDKGTRTSISAGFVSETLGSGCDGGEPRNPVSSGSS